MKLQLTEAELVELIPQLTRVLETGEPWEDKTLHHPVEAITKAVLSIDGVEIDADFGVDGFESNGWQYDWWKQFTFDNKKFTLSGSGSYGGHAFHLADEQE